MSTQATDLLRLLSAQAVPGLAPTSAANQPKLGGLDFSKLLQEAQAGQLASGREVTIGRGAGVTLSDDQIKRISVAADIAEAQGATRALVNIDGMSIKLDVSMREVTGAVDLEAVGVLTGIDAVIEVPPSRAVGAEGSAQSGSVLLKSLAGRAVPRAA